MTLRMVKKRVRETGGSQTVYTVQYASVRHQYLFMHQFSFLLNFRHSCALPHTIRGHGIEIAFQHKQVIRLVCVQARKELLGAQSHFLVTDYFHFLLTCLIVCVCVCVCGQTVY